MHYDRRMETAAKVMIAGGLLIAATGGVMWIGARMGLGRLPGDIFIDSGNVKVVVPIASMIIISVVLTIVLNVAMRLWR
jgi:hypothetical protein